MQYLFYIAYIHLRAENGGMLPCKQTFLAGQQLGAMFVWTNLATADSLYGRPLAINQAAEDLADNSRGHTITTETAFKSSHINEMGCWHETKRKRAGRRDGPVVWAVSSLDRTGLHLEESSTTLSHLSLRRTSSFSTAVHTCQYEQTVSDITSLSATVINSIGLP